jgi:uncharacterized membrane protein
MLIIILGIIIALVTWSLRLMQQAVDRQEFSLMLAGTLVAFSASALVVVYFLAESYIGYVNRLNRFPSTTFSTEYKTFPSQSLSSEGFILYSSLSTTPTIDY